MTEGAVAGSPQHIVMLAGNDITSHPRVLKYIATADRFGLRVTAVGIAAEGQGSEAVLGSARVVRVAVPMSYAGPLGAVRGRLSGVGRVAGAVRPWYWTREEYTRGLQAYQARASTPGVAPRRLRVERAVLGVRARPWRWHERYLTWRADDSGSSAFRARRLAAYRARPRLARWREVLPETLAQERAIGPVLDDLAPDAIHVHDVFLIGVAVQAAERAAAAGRRVAVVYDAHEYVPGLAVGAPRRIAAYADLESEFIGRVDRVITVSEPLADLIVAGHGLDRRPDIVLNATVADDGTLPVDDVREVVGLDASLPLLVYGGGVNPARGVQTLVQALALVPDVHLAVVVKRQNPMTASLVNRARRLGVEDRLHFAPFVAPEVVPRYLSSATIGTSPLLHVANHDVALTNKFCEYIAGGLPILTSDTPAQADLVVALDLGAVHVAGDAADCARGIRDVLADLPRLHDRITQDAALRHRFSWAAQAEVLREVWTDVLGPLPQAAWAPGATTVTRLLLLS